MNGPQPSVKEMQQFLAAELSGRSRTWYTLLLLFDLIVASAVGSLLFTEPNLPTRTRIAFGCIVLVALAWALVIGRTLARKKVLLARHRVVTGRLAAFVTAVFMLAALVLAATTPAHRDLGLAAGSLGAVMFAVALFIWRRAARRLDQLIQRTRKLERGLTSCSLAQFLLVLIGGSLVFLPGEAIAQQLSPAPIEMQVAGTLEPVAALGRHHLVYEIHITHFGLEPRQVVELSALDATTDQVLASWSREKLADRLDRVGVPTQEQKNPRLLVPGSRTVAYLWVTLEPGSTLPQSIKHRLKTVDTNGESEHTLVSKQVQLGSSDLPRIGPAVAAGSWVAVRGPSNSSGHRRSLVALDGAAWLAQRFAVDWVRLGEDGRLFRNDGSRNEDWYGYGQPVRAARAGRIARVVQGVPDHAPLSSDVQKFAAREVVSGNTVVVDEGDGRFAVYAHLRPGSISVSEGESVPVGAHLGNIGNSGHSLAPHLHFHVGDSPDPLASEGLPFVLDTFRLLGRIDSVPQAISGAAWIEDPRRPARDVEGEIPLENMIVRFD